MISHKYGWSTWCNRLIITHENREKKGLIFHLFLQSISSIFSIMGDCVIGKLVTSVEIRLYLLLYFLIQCLYKIWVILTDTHNYTFFFYTKKWQKYRLFQCNYDSVYIYCIEKEIYFSLCTLSRYTLGKQM
jgi:hypothetical protein